MVSITSTFNEQANQYVFLLVMFLWISASIDADKKEEKAKKRKIARNIAKKPKPAPFPPIPAGFR